MVVFRTFLHTYYMDNSITLWCLVVTKGYTYLNKPAALLKFVWPFVTTSHYRIKNWTDIHRYQERRHALHETASLFGIFI